MFPYTITSFNLYKIKLHMGRVIGDCGCAYDEMSVVVLELHTADGSTGWGFGETPRGGVFTRGAEWIVHMPSVSSLNKRFEAQVWPRLKGQSGLELLHQYASPFDGGDFVERAVRIALYDLVGKALQKPLWKLFGGDNAGSTAPLYASGLEFNLSHSEAAALHRSFVTRGFTKVKVKVGHPELAHDVTRLQAIRDAVGQQVEIAIDANEAWTVEESLRRIEAFQREGLNIHYLEDPILRTNLSGMAELSSKSPIDIVGHDYISDLRTLRHLLETKALRRLRITADYSGAFAQIRLAEEFGVPMIAGSTLFEANYHVPAGLGRRIERSEFPDLSWNLLPKNPIEIRDGQAVLSDLPGHGLDPDPDALAKFDDPEESPISRIGRGAA